MTWNSQAYCLKTIHSQAFSIGSGSAPKGYPEDRLSPHCLQAPTPNLESLTEAPPGTLWGAPWGEVEQSQWVSRLVRELAMGHFLPWTALGKSCKRSGPPLPIFNTKSWVR